MPALFLPAIGWLLWRGFAVAGLGVALSVVLFAGGLVVWSLIEYWLHRLFFHWQPDAPWGERMHFLVHGVHHKWPRDKYRLVMPPAVSISLYFIFLGVFYSVLGGRFVWPFQAGFCVGYMSYDLTHYYIHHFNPKTAYGRRLKKHHMLHHFKTPEARFGVSSVFWDLVFGTKA